MKCKKIIILMLVIVALLMGCEKRKKIDEMDLIGVPNWWWGLSLSVENVTPTGLTLVCTQSGGEAIGDLRTGSYYSLIVQEEDGWYRVPYLIPEDKVVWTMQAYNLSDNTVKWDIGWEWLYGKLPSGTYRILKTITDEGGEGEFVDSEVFYVEFEIEETD